MSVVAHGIGGVQDLPVPQWLFYWGAAVVLVASFVLLGALWKEPLLERRATGRSLPPAASRLVLGPLRILVQAVSVVLFALVWAAAAFGDSDPFRNLAPTWVYVVFWLGVPFLSALLGDVWRALSPWRALADAFVWARQRTGGAPRPLAAYPEALGRWPATVALFAFAALELAYVDPASPRALAFAIALYTYVTLFGMAAFGRETWAARGEAFAVLFAYFARIAPLHALDGRVRVRWPLTGLAGVERAPGSVAFLAVMLGSVAFDGYSRTTTWQDLVARIEGSLIVERPGVADLAVTALSVGGILAGTLLVGLAFLAACSVAAQVVNAPRPLAPEFLLSLVPIAFVYEVAHYFSLLVSQGQFAVPLLSDPLGRGWDLLGTADVVPDLTVLTPNTIWYVQAGALVAGHVAGLALAHDRAVRVFADRRAALRSQYAMLALMVVYTVGGLWILSRG
ncbi:MAG: fenitrothion hydrolase [Thermoleophilia bacterium]|nr:fenitrothion hydrolase [Thermoleophilia bacterium]